MVEQQHDQAADRLVEALHVFAGGEAVAGLGGEVAALAVVEVHRRRVGVGAPADARHELAAGAEHLGQPIDALLADLAAGVGGEFDVLERDALDPGRELVAGHRADVEQHRRGSKVNVGWDIRGPYLCRDPASSAWSGVVGIELSARAGGACARLAGRVVCARAPGLTSVHDPRVGSEAGDEMFDGGKRRDKPAWSRR